MTVPKLESKPVQLFKSIVTDRAVIPLLSIFTLGIGGGAGVCMCVCVHVCVHACVCVCIVCACVCGVRVCVIYRKRGEDKVESLQVLKYYKAIYYIYSMS